MRSGRLSDQLLPSGSRLSAGRTRPRIPPGRVGLLLEIRAGDERLGQILWILDDGGHREPDVAVPFREQIVVLTHRRARAVGHTVLAKVPRPQVRRDNFERAPPGAL